MISYNDIATLTKEISDKLQELESSKDKLEVEQFKIEFPHGVLRRAASFRNELTFIADETLKRNISYHLILADFYKWFLGRFNIGLTAREMLIKEVICLYGNVCAAVVRNITKKGVKPSIQQLRKRGIIDDELKEGLLWLWNTRCKEHIETLREWEYNKYSISDFEKAAQLWKSLKERLRIAKKSW